MNIRTETPRDVQDIAQVIEIAFAGADHASGQEAAIVERLRASGRLTLSLVAEEAGHVVGHVAFSPVQISDGAADWYGLGPVAVLPERQGQGIGKALIEQGLRQLRDIDANGCVVLGDPGYYARFGFRSRADIVLPGVPPEYFQALPLRADAQTSGIVSYHEAFDG
jgi:putative acetyltransferase